MTDTDNELTPAPAAVEALARFLRRLDSGPATPGEAEPAAGKGKSWSALLLIHRTAEDTRDG